MSRIDEAVVLLEQGLPFYDIKSEMNNISGDTILNYLFTAVGQRKIKRSDILKSLPINFIKYYDLLIEFYNTTRQNEIRNIIDNDDLLNEFILLDKDLIDQKSEQENYLYKLKYNLCECLPVYLKLRGTLMGDIYEYISDIEMTLHSFVKRELENEFGQGEDGWWRKGIPLRIRQECVSKREADIEYFDNYCYTNFIDLRDILERNWKIFSNILSKSWFISRNELCKKLTTLNQIRNWVMHPIKGKELSASDYFFIQEFYNDLKRETNLSRILSDFNISKNDSILYDSDNDI